MRVGDQRGNARALMEAAGVLDGLSYRLAWSEFTAAAPLLEALNAGAIDAGGVGHAPFTCAAAAGVPVKAIAAVRNRQDGLAILVAKASPVRSVADLKGKRIATNRGSIEHQVVLAALEEAGLPFDSVTFNFLPPADAKLALTSGAVDAWAPGSLTHRPPSLPSWGGSSGTATASRRASPSRWRATARSPPNARCWPTSRSASPRRGTGPSRIRSSFYAAVWLKLIGLPEAVPLRWFGRAAYRAVPIDATVVAGEQRNIDLYVRAGLIPVARAPQAGTIRDPSFGPAAVAVQ